MREINTLSELKQVFSELEIGFESKSTYNVECPVCAKTRKKQSTKSLHIKINPPWVNYRCCHNDCLFMSGNSFKISDSLSSEIEVITLNPIPIPKGQYPFENPHSIWHPYYNQNKELMFYIERNSTRQSPKVLPWMMAEDKEWYCKRPSGKFLYKSELLGTDSTCPVIIVEGEKTADAAAKIFTQADVVTWVGGCKEVKNAPWELLKGRKCYLWPDNDKVGIEAMKIASEIIESTEIYLIDTTGLPEAWDLADDGIIKEEIGIRYKGAQNVSKPLLRGSLDWEELQTKIKEKPDLINTSFGFSLPSSGVAVFMGRTNHGKSAMMINLACDLLKNTDRSISFISYEIPIIELVERFTHILTDLELKSYIESDRLFLSDEDVSIPEIKDLTRRLREKDKRSVIFIDYIQIMPTITKDFSQRYVQVKNMVQALREVGNQYESLIVTGSQTTAGNTNSKDNPYQDQARESRDIEFTSTFMARIWNKKIAKNRTNTEFFEDTIGEFIVQILKARGTVEVGKTFGFNWENGTKLISANKRINLTQEAF